MSVAPHFSQIIPSFSSGCRAPQSTQEKSLFFKSIFAPPVVGLGEIAKVFYHGRRRDSIGVDIENGTVIKCVRCNLPKQNLRLRKVNTAGDEQKLRCKAGGYCAGKIWFGGFWGSPRAEGFEPLFYSFQKRARPSCPII